VLKAVRACAFLFFIFRPAGAPAPMGRAGFQSTVAPMHGCRSRLRLSRWRRLAAVGTKNFREPSKVPAPPCACYWGVGWASLDGPPKAKFLSLHAVDV
jgi:hypothetical protein